MLNDKSRTEPKRVMHMFADSLLGFDGERAEDENCALVAN
jgi:hypothetical protein